MIPVCSTIGKYLKTTHQIDSKLVWKIVLAWSPLSLMGWCKAFSFGWNLSRDGVYYVIGCISDTRQSWFWISKMTPIFNIYKEPLFTCHSTIAGLLHCVDLGFLDLCLCSSQNEACPRGITHIELPIIQQCLEKKIPQEHGLLVRICHLWGCTVSENPFFLKFYPLSVVLIKYSFFFVKMFKLKFKK